MSGVSRNIDRFGVVFDDESLVADAGLLAAGVLMGRLGVVSLVDATVRLGRRVGAAAPGRKVATLVAAMLVGATHIDHVDRLRAGATAAVLVFARRRRRRSGRSCARSRGVTSANSTRLPGWCCVGRGQPAAVPARRR